MNIIKFEELNKIDGDFTDSEFEKIKKAK